MRFQPAKKFQLTAIWLAILCLSFASSGATCARRRTISEFSPPIVFETTPTLEQVADHINRSRAIHRLESATVTISSPEIVANLQGNLAWQSPSNFRLQAYPGTRLMGNVLDAGSNTESFWLQTQYPPPPTLFYARHDQFEAQLAPRRKLPVSPLWLKEALGVIELDSTLQHEGPIVRADGKLQIKTRIPTLRGDYRRILVIEPTRGVIQETMLYDPNEKLIASAQQSEHQFYSAVNFSLPHRVHLQIHPSHEPAIAFTVEIGFFNLNQPSGDDSLRFVMPDPTGLTLVDLVQANAADGQMPASPPAYSPQPGYVVPPIGFSAANPNLQPKYR